MEFTWKRVLTSPCRMMTDVLDPKVERIPAISTAIYPAPTITLRLQRQTQTMLSRGHTDTNFLVTCLQSVLEPNIVTHFGRVSSSKKPSLVMPRFAPVKRRDTKMALLTRHFQFPVLSRHPELHKGNNSKWGSTLVFHKCNGRGH